MGYITVTYGLGCISGPLIGSFLYTLGGYQCPLFTLGGLYLIMIITLWPLAKEERLKQIEQENMRKSSELDKSAGLGLSEGEKVVLSSA